MSPSCWQKEIADSFFPFSEEKREREKGTLPSPCKHMGTVCACTFESTCATSARVCHGAWICMCRQHTRSCKPSFACVCKDCTCVHVASLMSGCLPCWTRCVPSCSVAGMSVQWELLWSTLCSTTESSHPLWACLHTWSCAPTRETTDALSSTGSPSLAL